MAKKRIDVKCTYCEEIFQMKPYLAKIPTKHGRFCSATCRSKFAARIVNERTFTSIIIKCAFCGKDVLIQPYRLINVENNFCSKSCSVKFQLRERWKDAKETITVFCNYCGKEKVMLKWDLEQKQRRGQDKFYCNRSCFGKWKAANWNGENNPSWQGGWTPHGKGWDIIRGVVRKEQDYKCFDCKVSEYKLGRELDIHHIIPARLFKRKSDASHRPNLMGLCHSCHMKREFSEIPLFKQPNQK